MSSRDDSKRIEKQAHRYAEYEAQDRKGEPVGHVDDLFVDTVNGQEYVELNMGALGLRSTIVPLEICTVDEERMVVVIPQSRTKLRRAPRKRAPLLGDEVMAITPEYEDRVRVYFGLAPAAPATEDRPFRAFSTAYSSGGETSGRDVRPVEARRLDSSPTEPVRPEAADEPEAIKADAPTAEPRRVEPRRLEPQASEPDAIEAQDAESVEPEVVGPQAPGEVAGREAVGSETTDAGATEGEAQDGVRVVEPKILSPEDTESSEPEAAGPRETTEPEPIDLAAQEDETVEVLPVESEVREPVDAETDVTPRVEEVPVGVSETSYGSVGSEETVAAVPGAEDEGAGQAAEESPQSSPLTAGTPEVETAGEQMTRAARQSLQALTDRAVTAQESNLEFSRSIAQSFVEQLQSQTQGNRQAAQALQQQGQRQQQALQTIVQGSVSAYTNLLASTFSVYQQTLQSATRIALDNLQAAARLAPRGGAVVPAPGAQRGAQAAAAQGIKAEGQAVQRSSGEAGQGPSQGGTELLATPPRKSSGGAGPTPENSVQEEGDRQDAEAFERTAAVREGDAGATEPVSEPVRQDAKGSSGETITGSGTEPVEDTDEAAGEIDEAAPAGAGEPSGVPLPPPPVVPNILDELPPAPQAPSVDETLGAEERPKERE